MAKQALTTDISVYKNNAFISLRGQNIYANNAWQSIAASNYMEYLPFSVYNASDDTWYTLTTPLYIPDSLYSYETNPREGRTNLVPSWEDANYQGQHFKLLSFEYGGAFPLICDYPSEIVIADRGNFCMTNFGEDVTMELVYSNSGLNNWFTSVEVVPMIYVINNSIQGVKINVTPTGSPNRNMLHAEWLAKGVQTGIYYFGIKLQCYTIDIN